MEREQPAPYQLPVNGWMINAKLSRLDYQSFLKDLTRFADLALTAKGLGTPLQTRSLKTWINDRFDHRKYREFSLTALFAGTDMWQILYPVLYHEGMSPSGNTSADERVLEFDNEDKVWTFDLYGADAAIAASAFGCAKRILRETIRELLDNPKEWVKALIHKYFSVQIDGSSAALKILRRIRMVYISVDCGFGEGHHSVILCKSDGRSHSGRASLAYVNPNVSIKDGAMIFLGPKFFGPEKLDGDRGCTILHEATHLFAGTDDVTYKGSEMNAYGRSNCRKLPSDLALKNADSFALFAHDVYRQLRKNGGIDDFDAWADNVKLERW